MAKTKAEEAVVQRAPLEDNQEHLKAFHDELKALLEKYCVTIEVRNEIVAVDLRNTKAPESPSVSLDAQ